MRFVSSTLFWQSKQQIKELYVRLALQWHEHVRTGTLLEFICLRNASRIFNREAHVCTLQSEALDSAMEQAKRHGVVGGQAILVECTFLSL